MDGPGLLADGRCGWAVLDILSSTDVGRLVPPLEEEGSAASEVYEWELRKRRERQEEQEGEGGAGCGGRYWRWGGTSVVPSRPLIHGIGRRGVGDGSRFSFVLSFVNFLGHIYSFLGKAWAEGKGELATSRHCADCGPENWAKCTPP